MKMKRNTNHPAGNLLPPSPVSDTHCFSMYIFHSQRLLFKRETSVHTSFSRFCGVFCVGVFPLVSKSIFSSSSQVGEVSYIHPFIFFLWISFLPIRSSTTLMTAIYLSSFVIYWRVYYENTLGFEYKSGTFNILLVLAAIVHWISPWMITIQQRLVHIYVR